MRSTLGTASLERRDCCRKTLQLMKDEKEPGKMMYMTLYDAFQIFVANGDMARAISFQSLALKQKRTNVKARMPIRVGQIQQFIKTLEKDV